MTGTLNGNLFVSIKFRLIELISIILFINIYQSVYPFNKYQNLFYFCTQKFSAHDSHILYAESIRLLNTN